MIQIEGEITTRLQLVDVLRRVDMLPAVGPDAQVDGGIGPHVETGAVAVGQGRPAHLLAVAVVLREG